MAGRNSGGVAALLAGGFAVVAGSWLPWARASAPAVGADTTSGIDTRTGWITLIAGVTALLAAAVAWTARSPVGAKLAGIAAGLVAAAAALSALADIDAVFSRSHLALGGAPAMHARVGVGLPVVVAGAVVVFAAAVALPARA